MEINNYRAILHSIVKTEAEWNTINTVIPVNQVVYAVVSKTENVLNYYVKVGDGIHNFVELPKGNLTTAEIREIVATINQTLDQKVTITNERLKIYGTDENGNQTTFDFDLLGLVDDVLVKNNKDDEYHTVISEQKAYIDLSGKVDHFDRLPEASASNVGQVVQYTGADTEDLISGCFYQSTETYVGSSITITPSEVEIEASIDKDTFESFVQPTEDMTLQFVYVSEPAESGDTSGSGSLENFWTLDGFEVELSDYGIEATGPIIDGDTLIVEYDFGSVDYTWVKKDTTDISEKVDKTHDRLKIYGTDENGNQKFYDKEDFGKVDDVQLNGTSVVDRTTKIANLEPEAGDIAYTNEQYPAMQTLQDAMDKLLYINPSVSLKIDDTAGDISYEVGSTKSTTSLSWTWNKNPKSQSLNQGIGSLETNVRSYFYETPITSNTSFTISGSDGTNPASSTRSVLFKKYYYYGISVKDTLSDADIRALASSRTGGRAWASSNQTLSARDFNCTPTEAGTPGENGFYAYFVLPTEYAKSSYKVTINGQPNSGYLKTTKADYTNEYGVVIPMTIFRFVKDNKLTTTYTIGVN